MWNQFLLINFHFTLHVVAGLIFFMVSWLYFDAWFEHRALKNTCKVLGFFFLALSFFFQATSIDSPILVSPFLSVDIVDFMTSLFRLAGYFGVALGFILDPLPIVPKTKGLVMDDVKVAVPFSLKGAVLAPWIFVLLPIGAGLVGFLHLRRATKGLENHLKVIGWGINIIALSELCGLFLRARDIQSVFYFNLLRPFGFVWILEHILLLLGILLVGSWVFHYLLKRLQSQIFIIYSCSVFIIFAIITVTFTWLLLRSIETEALKQLETDVKVLRYAVESKEAETISDASALAQSPQLGVLLSKNNTKEMETLAEAYLLSKNLTSVSILNVEGVISARGEDKEHTGISLSGDELVKMGLSGIEGGSILSRKGVLAADVSIGSVSPIYLKDKIIGIVLVERKLDNAFVDGVKSATGLEVSIYGGNALSATTLVAQDKTSRANGIIEENEIVKKKVLDGGEFYQTSSSILNTQYLATYMPIRNGEEAALGMFFVGRPEITILASAARSMQATFIIANLLLIFSIIPSYLIARYISRQMT